MASLDQEESERLLRMRPFKQEARSREAHSLTAASQIDLAELGEQLGVVPIQEQRDELESERLLRMWDQSELMRLGEKLGVVTSPSAA